jgi:hypothetical protein
LANRRKKLLGYALYQTTEGEEEGNDDGTLLQILCPSVSLVRDEEHRPIYGWSCNGYKRQNAATPKELQPELAMRKTPARCTTSENCAASSSHERKICIQQTHRHSHLRHQLISQLFTRLGTRKKMKERALSWAARLN